MGKYTLPPVCGNSSLYLPEFSIVTLYLLSIGEKLKLTFPLLFMGLPT